ncbi:MAG: hypothetical protein ABSB40_03325 [Nitrososphaeria archaeon]|jgi:hypothetical protein
MLTDSNKLFWTRVIFAALSGFVSGIMKFSGSTAFDGVGTIIFMYILSYFIGEAFIFKGKKVSRNTLILTGIGTFIMMSLFMWILFYTLKVNGFI